MPARSRGEKRTRLAITHPAAKVCPSCHAPAPPGRRICRKCYTNIEGATTAAMPSRAQRPRGIVWLLSLGWRGWFGLAAAAVLVVFAARTALDLRPAPPLPAPRVTALSVQAQPAVWPMADGGVGGGRVTTAAPVLDGEIAWSRALSAPIVTAPVTDGAQVFLGLEDARLVALSVADGRELWSVPVPGQLDDAPTLVGDWLYLGQRDGRVVALDTTTGEQRWASRVADGIYSSPAVADGVVYVVSSNRLLALDAEDRTVLADIEVGSWGNNISPVVSQERVVAATGGRILFFDRATGEQPFFARLRNPRHVATAGDMVVAMSAKSILGLGLDGSTPWWEGIRGLWTSLHLHEMAPAVPQPYRWAMPAKGDAFAPVLTADRVFIASAGGSVQALDLASGGLLWEIESAPLAAAPLLTASGLLVVEREALVLLDPDTGAELSRRELPGIALRSVTVVDGATFLVTETDELLALR